MQAYGLRGSCLRSVAHPRDVAADRDTKMNTRAGNIRDAGETPPARIPWAKVSIITAVLVIGVPLALLLYTFTADPLPVPPPVTDPLPQANPPLEMAIYGMETGVVYRRAGFTYRGGSWFEHRDSTVTATLVKHPRGDLLIDAGFGRHIDEQIKLDSLLSMTTGYKRFTSAAEQLNAIGYPRKSLRAILLTHAHWDHVSGIPDFPGTPVWVTAEEHRFIAKAGVRAAPARSATEAATFEEYGFDDKPYLGFPRSRDVYSDGSIVIVPTPGHTPGSVIIFVTLLSNKRYAFVGDLVWRIEGITLREEKPWLMRRQVDMDEKLLRSNLLHMIAIHERYPEITIVPAHDQRVFAEIPHLPSEPQQPSR